MIRSYSTRYTIDGRPMLEPERLAALMPPCLAVDVAVSDTEKYVVSARLR